MTLVVLSTLSMIGPVAAQTTIDFSGIIAPSSTHVAQCDYDDNVLELPTAPLFLTEFTDSMYSAISSSDYTYAVSRAEETYDYAQQVFAFRIDAPITSFTVTWIGNFAFYWADEPHEEEINIWNAATSSWDYVGTVTQVGSIGDPPDPPAIAAGCGVYGPPHQDWMGDDEIVSGTYTAVSDYIDGGSYIYLLAWGLDCEYATISTDYVKLEYTSAPVGGVWTPVNKFELLAPWIGLASLITVVAVSVGYVKRRKKTIIIR